MKIKLRKLCIALAFALLVTFEVAADEVTDVLNDVAAKLVLQLPMDQKIALKSLSPDETGLPEDFLRRLTSDLEAALLVASGFEINLANRATMEDVWQEAIEFNNADFEELYQSADADVMLMMAPRAVANGVEVALTAYALTGDNVGQILASSGTVLLPIDLQQSLGVNVNDLNQQMAEVLKEIERVGETGGLITDPNTYAEFYHNARVLQQRGEVDLAMRNYEQALAEGYLFVDPLLDLLDLANARYGREGVQIYFEKRIKDSLPKELSDLGALILGGEPVQLVQPILNKEVTFSPLLAIWLQRTAFDERYNTSSIWDARAIAGEIVTVDYQSGQFQSFYIDKIRGAADGRFIEESHESWQSNDLVLARQTSPAQVLHYAFNNKLIVGSITIQDYVDIEQDIIYCYKSFISQEGVCRILNGDVSDQGNADSGYLLLDYSSSLPNALFGGDGWNFGIECSEYIQYTDINGSEVKKPLFVSIILTDPDNIPEDDVASIVQCAGDYYKDL